jgi:hypothetical protein
MPREVFQLRHLPYRARQLAVKAFDEDAQPCINELKQRQFDLVLSFEVAEHIPIE